MKYSSDREIGTISRVYSPVQIACGSLLGGPVAAVYFLRANFLVLGKSLEAMQTLVWGIVFNIMLLSLLLVFQNNLPGLLIPLAYSYAAQFIAMKYQLPYEAIDKSAQYTFQSNWRVVRISFIIAVLYTIVLMAIIYSLDSLGEIKHSA
jgi:hypothetical protein